MACNTWVRHGVRLPAVQCSCTALWWTLRSLAALGGGRHSLVGGGNVRRQHQGSEVETLHLGFLRRLLGVSQAPVPIVFRAAQAQLETQAPGQ